MFDAKNPNIARIGVKGLEDIDSLTDEENVLYMAALQAQFAYIQSAFYLWHDGDLRDEIWNSIIATVPTALSTPGGKQFWERRRFSFKGAFGD